MPALDQPPQVVGIEVGNDTVTAAVVDASGRIVGQAVTRLRDCTLSPADAIRACISPAVDEARLHATAPLLGVGLALPGTLRPDEGLCVLSPTLGWENVNVRDAVMQAVGLPTTIVNAVRANLEGERQYGTGIGVDNLVCVSIGRTIEGGLCLQGQIFDGESDSAGEIGHLTVEQDGQMCSCGNQGCLETVASGTSVARMAADSLKLGAQSVLSEWTAEEQAISAELVYRAACEGDALAIRVWETMGRYLGLALSSVITLVNPQRVVINGSIAHAFDWFAPAMLEEVRRRARMVPRDYTEIVSSVIPLDAGLIGAAWYALQAAPALSRNGS